MGVLVAGGLTGLMNQPSAQVIDGSLKFDDSANQHLERTISASNRRTFTLSAWVKHSTTDSNDRLLGNYTDSNNYSSFYFRDTPDFQISFVELVSSSYNINAHSRRMARDTGWYHIVWAIDTTQSTDTDRVKLYVNGVQETLNAPYSSGTPNTNAPTLPSQNYDTRILAAYDLRVGARSGTDCWDGLMSQFYVIDGLALGPENFGFTDGLTNTWRPKKYTGAVNAPAIPPGGSSVVPTSTSNVAPSGSYGNGIATAALLFGGTELVNGQNHIRQDNGGIEWSPAIPLTGSDIAGAKCLYFNSASSSYTIEFKINGSWVTAQSNAQSIIGTTQGQGGLITLATTGDWTGVRVTGGSNTHVTTIAGIFVNGNLVYAGTAAGVNGFYLPLDGNSPIGDDKSGNGNNWTPVNFGGSVALPKATGALPILNTDGGGNVARVGVRTDAYHANLTLALPLVGGTNDVSNSVNSGSTTKSVSVSGDPAASSTQSNFYNGSFYFDGSSSSDYVSAADNTELDVGSGDFTIECWAYVSGYPNTNPGLLSKRGGNGAAHWQLVLNRNGQIQFGDQATWSNYFGTSSGTTGDQIFKDNWHHIVITRTSGSVQAWYDGRKYGTAINNTTDFSTSANFSVGVGREANYDPFQGYIQDVRVYKGVAKYTSNFIPASTSPDILPDTPSGVSGGSKLAKVTDGAVSFDGSGDYLTSAESSDEYDFPSGDWTIEYFAYCNSEPSDAASFSNTKSFSSAYRSMIVEGNSGNLRLLLSTDGSSSWATVGTTTNDLNKWRHIALVRNSGTISFYVDGISRGSTSSTPYDNANNNTVYFGRNGGDGSGYFSGFISNARIIKGTALYTANFTPPTRTLTNVTNTKLLCCQSPTSATEGAVKPGTITANGNAVATNFNPFNTDINTVRGQETGYCTWNPLSLRLNQGTLSDGNLTLSATGSYYIEAKSTFDASMVDNYSELSISSASGSDSFAFGIAASSDAWIISGVGTYLVYRENGAIIRYPGNTTVATVSSYTVGDVLGMAIDSTNVKFYKNNILQGTYAHGYSKDYFVTALNVPNSGTSTMTANFGQKPFKFPPPAGFQPLNGANVRPVKVFARPDQYVGATIYDGNGGTKNVSTNHSPDLVWIKHRTRSQSHVLYDSVRTAGTGKALASNSNGAEGAQSDGTTYGYLSAFNNNGFTVIKGSDGEDYVNKNATSYVAWSWKAGGNKNTFNVDDVGYANASDVNMNVGGLHNSATNSAQTWSSNITTTGNSGNWYPSFPATYIFDADTTNYGHANGDGSVACVVTLSFSPSITCNTSVTLYGGLTNTPASGGGTISINGGTAVALTPCATTNPAATDATVVPFSGSISSIVITKTATGGEGLLIYGFEIDGIRLTDNTAFTIPNVPSIAATGASVGTRQGFSIIKYTGNSTANATLPHGLSEAPKFVIIKNLSNTYGWAVLHTDAGTTGTTLDGSPEYYMLQLDVNAGRNNFSQDTIWNPTSTTVKIDQSGGANWVNNSNSSYIAYLWHDVPGLQKFGTYEGSGNIDTGPFVELGFKPALLIVKNIDDTENWYIYDPKRSPSNVAYQSLQASSGGAEETSSSNTQIDLLSNGFKLRQGNGPNNANTYIYAAWAEAPTFNLYGGQSNAR